MEVCTDRRRRRPSGRGKVSVKFKKAGVLTKLLILVMIVYAGYNIVAVQANIAEARQNLTSLTQQVEDARQANAQLDYAIEHKDDPETIEQIARAKLGLVKPGEKIFYDISQ